jgi:hypothetical protein
MRKLDKSRYSKAGESLGPDDIKAKYAVATIAGFDEMKREDGTYGCNLKLNEYGDKALWLNKTMLDYLTDEFGEDIDTWTGKKIALEKRRVNDVGTGKEKLKVYVAAPEDWRDIFAAAKGGKKK